jgi:hypothetical protein
VTTTRLVARQNHVTAPVATEPPALTTPLAVRGAIRQLYGAAVLYCWMALIVTPVNLVTAWLVADAGRIVLPPGLLLALGRPTQLCRLAVEELPEVAGSRDGCQLHPSVKM